MCIPAKESVNISECVDGSHFTPDKKNLYGSELFNFLSTVPLVSSNTSSVYVSGPVSLRDTGRLNDIFRRDF